MGPVEREVRKLLTYLDEIERDSRMIGGAHHAYAAKIRGSAEDMRVKIKKVQRKVKALEAE
jgi:hypothetical protein